LDKRNHHQRRIPRSIDAQNKSGVYERNQKDIVRFTPDDKPLEIWSKNYFKDLAKRIRFAY